MITAKTSPTGSRIPVHKRSPRRTVPLSEDGSKSPGELRASVSPSPVHIDPVISPQAQLVHVSMHPVVPASALPPTAAKDPSALPKMGQQSSVPRRPSGDPADTPPQVFKRPTQHHRRASKTEDASAPQDPKRTKQGAALHRQSSKDVMPCASDTLPAMPVTARTEGSTAEQPQASALKFPALGGSKAVVASQLSSAVASGHETASSQSASEASTLVSPRSWHAAKPDAKPERPAGDKSSGTVYKRPGKQGSTRAIAGSSRNATALAQPQQPAHVADARATPALPEKESHHPNSSTIGSVSTAETQNPTPPPPQDAQSATPARPTPTGFRRLIPVSEILSEVTNRDASAAAGATEVEDLFSRIGLKQYCAAFVDAGYDTLERFALLEREDMPAVCKDIKLGHMKQLLQVVALLNT